MRSRICTLVMLGAYWTEKLHRVAGWCLGDCGGCAEKLELIFTLSLPSYVDSRKTGREVEKGATRSHTVIRLTSGQAQVIAA